MRATSGWEWNARATSSRVNRCGWVLLALLALPGCLLPQDKSPPPQTFVLEVGAFEPPLLFVDPLFAQGARLVAEARGGTQQFGRARLRLQVGRWHGAELPRQLQCGEMRHRHDAGEKGNADQRAQHGGGPADEGNMGGPATAGVEENGFVMLMLHDL